LPTTNEYNILVHFFIENQQYYLNRICFRVKKMLHPVDWLKGSLNAEKYCRVQLLIKQKGVDENETSVSIRGEISFDSYLRCFQADDAGQMKAETCTFEVVLVIMYYKHISEKLTYIRRASHEREDKLYIPLYFYIFLIICNLRNP